MRRILQRLVCAWWQFLVLTRWQSQEALDRWLEDPDYKDMVAEMDKYTEGPAKYQVMRAPEDDLFLL